MTESESTIAVEKAAGALADPTSDSSREGVTEAIDRARAAQIEWAAMEIGERARRVARVARKLLAQAEELASLVHQEHGKPFEEALFGDVLFGAELIEAAARGVDELLREATIALDPWMHPRGSCRSARAPVGVVLVLAGSRDPIAGPLRAMIPTLLAGNSVVLKPSERASRVGTALGALFAGMLPSSVVEIVHGGATVGDAALEAGVDAVVFDGGPSAAKRVAILCARELVPVSIQVTVKGAALVLADASIKRAAQAIVWAAFSRSAESPGIDRVYVEDAVAKPLSDRVVLLSKQLRAKLDLGELDAADDAESRARVARAIEASAEPLVEGEVTVLRVANEDVDLLQEETRGPVLSIISVKSAWDAVARINRNRHASAASIWTSDIESGRKLARQLRVGLVALNNVVTPAFVGASTEGPLSIGSHSLDVVTQRQLIFEDGSRTKSEPHGYPYTPTLRALGLALAKARGGAHLFGRIVAMLRLLVLVPKRLFEKQK